MRVPRTLRWGISDEAAPISSYDARVNGYILSTERHVEVHSLLGLLLAKDSLSPLALQQVHVRSGWTGMPRKGSRYSGGRSSVE